ncbi:type 1 glutamine amidotransferase [Apibacter raozihei]|uniref:type 1 glutamine amidotransferase n=1 Tax=Apibacter raozihei TaxID=2500547 RepID=UPI000FE3586F|nr:type 1 glutamine amidotransferase [Apibacter raozihei]
MNLHFIQHETFEAPGAYLQWAQDKNHTFQFSKVFEKDLLPESVENIDMLIVLGGPQDPATTLEECSHFDSKAEISFIRKCIDAGKAVVGICLGSQLIGEALGARFEHSPEKEIGVFPIQLTEDGKKDEKVAHFGNFLPVGHWHNDMPGLTAQSKILAVSNGCPRQIVSYTPLVYGFQCHMEFTSEVMELLIAEEKDFLETQNTYAWVQKPEEIRSYNYNEMNEKLCIFLDKLQNAYQQSLS